MSNEFNINKIFEAFKKYGIDKTFINEILLPDWWTPEVTNTKAGYLQTISILAKNLGIHIENLLTDPENISLKKTLPIKYKTAKNVHIDSKNIWVQSLYIRISELIEKTFSFQYKELPEDSLEIRNEIIEKYGKINLENVLEFLWTAGIPVLFISEFPRGIHKMDGMVINFKGRPIILVSQNRKQSAWVLFIISHEIGHIIKKHISESEPIIYDTEFEQLDDDAEEVGANQEALRFLTGQDDPNFIDGTFDSSYRLANLARKISSSVNVDAGTIVLNYAYATKNYSLAQQALKVLDPKADAVNLVKSKMKNYLNFDSLSEENFEFFTKITAMADNRIETIS
ncbi:MAG: hypothetical protein Q7S39_07625 [Ignavibacteria bacterium]|nr:hypothetical protein [Ignavibacteria bacterium]